MTIEEQFALAAKEQNENLEREVIAGATYLRLINETFGPGSHYYAHGDVIDSENWDENQLKVWKYLWTNDHVSYIHLYELLTEIGTGGAVWRIVEHCLWMSYFCQVEEDEVDEILEQVSHCDDCRCTAIAYQMQFLLFACPMSAETVAALVHSGGMHEFAMMIWEVVEATGQGFYHTELRKNSLQAISG